MQKITDNVGVMCVDVLKTWCVINKLIQTKSSQTCQFVTAIVRANGSKSKDGYDNTSIGLLRHADARS
jgi:hypothetical protein